MSVSVTSDGVPTGGNLSNQIRALADIAPNQKKCCAGLISLQQVQEFWSHRRIRAIVERDGEVACRGGMANRGSNN